MKTRLKALVVAAVAAIGLGASSDASAYCGHGISYYRPAVWHDTTHLDYVPGGFVRHYDHFDYVPGYYRVHHTGHWHY
jgi:hypothetical protein